MEAPPLDQVNSIEGAFIDSIKLEQDFCNIEHDLLEKMEILINTLSDSKNSSVSRDTLHDYLNTSQQNRECYENYLDNQTEIITNMYLITKLESSHE